MSAHGVGERRHREHGEVVGSIGRARTVHRVTDGEAHARLAGAEVHGHVVAQLERQDQGLDVVQAVVAPAEYAEEHVELRVGGDGRRVSRKGFRHAGEGGQIQSFGTVGGRHAARDEQGVGGAASRPRRRRALRIVLRRCPNASSTTRQRRSGSTSTGGAGRRSIPITTEPTLGRGQNTSGGTCRRIVARA